MPGQNAPRDGDVEPAGERLPLPGPEAGTGRRAPEPRRGVGMGHGYKGGSEAFRSLADNCSKLKENFPFSQGYFGFRGKSGSSAVRNVYSDNPLSEARIFYDMIFCGGLEESIGKGKWKTTMADGTVVVMREVSHSSDGSPAVDINVRFSTDEHGVKSQKIHFVRRVEE